MIRLNTNDANTILQAGLSFNPGTATPGHGMYIEKQAADTSWFGVCRASSVQTRTSALATVSTNWVKFRIRRVDASTIGFTLDSGTEQLITTNIPTTGTGMHPFVTLSNTAAADKNVDLDYFHIFITGLSR
jgi:hypothetical protein